MNDKRSAMWCAQFVEDEQDSLQIFFMFNIDVDVGEEFHPEGLEKERLSDFFPLFPLKNSKNVSKLRSSSSKFGSLSSKVRASSRLQFGDSTLRHLVTGTSWSISTHLGNGACYVVKFHSVQQQLFSQGIARGEGPDNSKRHSLDGGLVTFRDQ